MTAPITGPTQQVCASSIVNTDEAIEFEINVLPSTCANPAPDLAGEVIDLFARWTWDSATVTFDSSKRTMDGGTKP